MMRLLGGLLGLSLLVPAAAGQAVSPSEVQQQFRPTDGPVTNTIQEMAPLGDSLWIGPLLTVYAPEDDQFLIPDDPVVEQRLETENYAVFSLATEPQASGAQVWAGLAFDTGGGTPGAGGFLVSTDGGHSFEQQPVQLDNPADTTVIYGGSTLPAIPVTQQANSTPQDFAIGQTGDTVWVAGGRSGLRRSTDGGQSWSRVVLPPDTVTSIQPTTSYDFEVGPPVQENRGFRNHTAYSVLLDETGTLWAGTAAGVNRSTPADVGAEGDRGWRLFPGDGPVSGISGQGVVALAEQPRPDGRNPIWMATWVLAQGADDRVRRFGVAMTPDGGETFRPMLLGERVYELAARANRVYAAAQSGLFVSGNGGQTWRSIDEVQLQEEDQVLPGGISARSVEVTPSALWVGTTDGLLRLDREDEPRLLPGDPGAEPPEWRVYRTDVPVNPEEPTEQVPDVETYAYPNPFVPPRDEVVRIVYEVPEPQMVEVNIYDFSMNQVRTLREQEASGRQEVVWKGTDEGGLRLPTGTYLYTVELGDRTVRGKILLSN